MEQYIKCELLKGELLEVHHRLLNEDTYGLLTVLLFKNAIVSIQNAFELIKTLKTTYESVPALKAKHSKYYEEWLFLNYIRNNVGGHIDDRLVLKTLEFKPELVDRLPFLDQENTQHLFYLGLFETVINTYIKKNGEHEYFDYDPEFGLQIEHFLKLLTYTVNGTIDFLGDLAFTLKSRYEKDINIGSCPVQRNKYWIDAQDVNFDRLKKR